MIVPAFCQKLYSLPQDHKGCASPRHTRKQAEKALCPNPNYALNAVAAVSRL